MLAVIRALSLAFFWHACVAFCAELPSSLPIQPPLSLTETTYNWSTEPVGTTAEILTLTCHNCAEPVTGGTDLPLLSVMRDTLGDASPENDRLSCTWLLNTMQFTLRQRLLSAVPFFYWRIADGSTRSAHGVPAPLLNLNAPRHPVIAKAARSLLQWAAFDPLATSVRASSRSYEANQEDHERLLLEQTIGYLRDAPTEFPDTADHGAVKGLTANELDTLIARLELRKSLLGGLLKNERAPSFGQQANFEAERIRIRNFDALRQFAEKTGTYFEPLNLAGSTSDFAILWFALGSSQPSSGASLRPIWKLLNVRDPWSDASFPKLPGPFFQRAFDADDRLLPPGSEGIRTATLIPLGVYSLTYPKMPLLLVDFRDGRQVQRHEMLQRSITELTGGLLGISHFANWYYFAGAALYQSIWSRRGTAANQASRLDCYSHFRMQLELDHQLDVRLHNELSRRSEWLNVNPLDSRPAQSALNAQAQYSRLQKAAKDSALGTMLNRDRLTELAAFQESTRTNLLRNAFHLFSLGLYSRSQIKNSVILSQLDRNRRIQYQLQYLDSALANGTDPSVAFRSADLDEAVIEVRELLGDLDSEPIRRHVRETLARLRKLSPWNEEVAKTLLLAQQPVIQ